MMTIGYIEPVSLNFFRRIASRYDGPNLLASRRSPLVSANGIVRSLNRWIDLVYVTPYVRHETLVREKDLTKTAALVQSIENTWNVMLQLGGVNLSYLSARETKAGLPSRVSNVASTEKQNTITVRDALEHHDAPILTEHITSPGEGAPPTGQVLQAENTEAARGRSPGALSPFGQEHAAADNKQTTSAFRKPDLYLAPATSAGNRISDKVEPIAKPRPGKDTDAASRPSSRPVVRDSPGMKKTQADEMTGPRRPAWPALELIGGFPGQTATTGQHRGPGLPIAGPVASAGSTGSAGSAGPVVEWPDDTTTTGYDIGPNSDRAASREIIRDVLNTESRFSGGLVGQVESSNIDMERISDQVYRMLERRIRIERERRGL